MKKIKMFLFLTMSILFIAIACPCYSQESEGFLEEPKSFSIISDKDFSGVVFYYPLARTVRFDIVNTGSRSFTLKKAQYFAVTKEVVIYGLQIEEEYNINFPNESLMINPAERMMITCKSSDMLNIQNIKGFNIWLYGGRRIRFGYEVLTYKEKASRFIKELWDFVNPKNPKKEENYTNFNRNYYEK